MRFIVLFLHLFNINHLILNASEFESIQPNTDCVLNNDVFYYISHHLGGSPYSHLNHLLTMRRISQSFYFLFDEDRLIRILKNKWSEEEITLLFFSPIDERLINERTILFDAIEINSPFLFALALKGGGSHADVFSKDEYGITPFDLILRLDRHCENQVGFDKILVEHLGTLEWQNKIVHGKDGNYLYSSINGFKILYEDYSNYVDYICAKTLLKSQQNGIFAPCSHYLVSGLTTTFHCMFKMNLELLSFIYFIWASINEDYAYKKIRETTSRPILMRLFEDH